MKHLLGSLEAHCFNRPSQLLPIDKWAWPLIKSVEMQVATSAGRSMNTSTGVGIRRLEADSEV